MSAVHTRLGGLNQGQRYLAVTTVTKTPGSALQCAAASNSLGLGPFFSD
jgi:hypothetical protein